MINITVSPSSFVLKILIASNVGKFSWSNQSWTEIILIIFILPYGYVIFS